MRELKERLKIKKQTTTRFEKSKTKLIKKTIREKERKN